MNVLIVEDEASARDHLLDLLKDEEVSIVGTIASIEEAVSYLSKDHSLDLLFMDIHLSDGSAFEIFRKVDVQTPIIFTTAYDQYLQDAFGVHSIAYLLKPITRKNLHEALDKHRKLSAYYQQEWGQQMKGLLEHLTRQGESFRQRFLVKVGLKFKPVEITQVDAFFRDEAVYLFTNTDEKYPINDSLDAIEHQIDMSAFIRLNRQVIVRKNFIENLEQYPGSKLLAKTKKPLPLQIIVSQEKASWVKESLGF